MSLIHTLIRSTSLACFAVGAMGLAPGMQAQEIVDLPELGGNQGDAAQELVKLFHQVERNLERIDNDLADAGAGELPLESVGDSGLLELLRESQRQSRQVEDSINRILEIAQDMGQGQGPPSGESPLNQPPQEGPQGRERTPGAPKPEGESQDEPQDSPGDEEHQGQPEETPGENREGEAPQRPPGDPSQSGRDANEWGFLPDRLREVFRNQGGETMPVRYRSWIDAYYRRLNRSDR